ncbi:ATP-binding protein [Georgenia sp. 311]|uniref:ATP-binding protein n=1 Tax=Georgenia wutianyii TaxID=2585135 RepID=A0ABX5VLR0_9MICO|nr:MULTISPECIES: ATP-binding protein [Georgenia]QDB79140.1 ATP-binding protein [Georgenia wutianyii]TNC19191.1 ATP-binding protein [Georgenia sp. 311]
MRELVAALARALERRPGLPATAHAALAALEADAADLTAVDGPLEEVAGRLGLGGLDSGLLAVALAPELHPSAHLLLGLLSGDDGAARPSVALALELTGSSTLAPAPRRRLGLRAPLRRFGLLDVLGEDVLLSRRLRVADRVVAHLLGDDTVPAALAPLLAPALPVTVEGTSELAGSLAGGAGLCWVSAPPGTAGTALAVAACLELDVLCLVADLTRPGAPDAADTAGVRQTVRGLVLEAALGGAVLVLAGAETAAPAMDLLADAPVPVVAVGSRPWDARWHASLPPVVTAPRLTTEQRRQEWRTVLGGADPGPEVTALRLDAEQIHLVGRAAREEAAARGKQLSPGLVAATARRLGRSTRAGHGGGTATLGDLVLPAHARDEVERLISWARHRDDVLALGDLQGKGGKGGGIAALFSGSPGTGKTLAAHVVADALGMDLFQVDLSAVVDKYIGETEKNLERVFTEAESLNCVLFFDEADAVFGSRSAVSDAKDRYANQEVAYLLQRMEAFDGITVLATNLRGNLDQAFARRLHFMIHFPDPDAGTRRRLWEHHLAPLALDPHDPVDLDVLAEHVELAGGDIRNIVLAATFEAVARDRPVGMAHLGGATVREYGKLGRRPPAVVLAAATSLTPLVQ